MPIPNPTYAWLRRHRPVCPVKGGGYLLTRHADVAAALASPNLGNAPSRFSVLLPRHRQRHLVADMAARLPPFLDMPDHRPARQALVHAFFRTFEGFEPTLAGLAEGHAGKVPQDAAFDLVSAVASPYACAVIGHFVGTDAGWAELKQASSAFFRLFAPITDRSAFADANKELALFRDELKRSVEARRRERKNDLISALLDRQDAEPAITDDHVVDSAMLILADGVENIEAAIVMTLRQVLATAGLGEAIRSGRQAIEPVAREPALRYPRPDPAAHGARPARSARR